MKTTVVAPPVPGQAQITEALIGRLLTLLWCVGEEDRQEVVIAAIEDAAQRSRR